MSTFLPKTYQTKSEHTILIREAVPEDANQLLKLKLEYLKNTITIPLFDYEYPNTVGEERQLIKRYQQENNSLLLVAENNKSIVGNIDLTGSWRKKTSHTAVIGMGIHTEWQNQGVGTLLIQNVLDWARKNELLQLLWLEVYATNKPGITLYEKTSFKEAGRIKAFFKENQKYIDKITLISHL